MRVSLPNVQIFSMCSLKYNFRFCPDTNPLPSLSSSLLSSLEPLSDHSVSCQCQIILSQCLSVPVALLRVSPHLFTYQVNSCRKKVLRIIIVETLSKELLFTFIS